jgi:hypothetical protein
MPTWIWILLGSFAVAVIVLLVIRSIIYRSAYAEKEKLNPKDQAVLDDFRNWAQDGNLSKKEGVSGFQRYAQSDRYVLRDTGAGSLSKKEDPVCPNCGTVYNRAVVISLIKQQSPEIFDFQSWTTRFICKKCRQEIVISGERGE